MIDDPELEAWAKKYATRIRAEAQERFPNDAHARIQYALKSAGMPAVMACRTETGNEPPEEAVWRLVDKWHILLSDPVLHREMYPEDFRPPT